MSRLFITALMASSLWIMGCQQQKIGSNPQPAVQPRTAVNTPPPNVVNTPPPPTGVRPGPPPVAPPPTTTVGPIPPPGGGPRPTPPPPPPPTGGNPPPPIVNHNPPPVVNTPPPVTVTPSNPPPTVNNNPPPVVNNPPPPTTTNNPPPVVTNNPPLPPPTTTTTPPPTTVVTNNPPPPPVVTTTPPPTTVVTTTPPPTTVVTNTPPMTVTTQTTPPPTTTTIVSNEPPTPPPTQSWAVTQVAQPTPAACTPSSTLPCPTQTLPLQPLPVAENCQLNHNCENPTPAEKPTVVPVVPQITLTPTTPLPSTPTPQVTTGGELPPPTPLVVDNTPKKCEPVKLPAIKEIKKLDVLLLIDTSGSMRGGHRIGMGGELGHIARDMHSFAQQFGPNTDIQFGMILGHARQGTKSTYKHGTLFSYGAKDPAVVSLSALEKKCGNRTCAMKEAGNLLSSKIQHLPNDESEGQGEALLLSLYDSITNDGLRQNLKQLVRSDASLVVIPISDEQDVCYDYASRCNAQTLPNLTANELKVRCTPAQVKDKKTGKMGEDQHEVNFRNDAHECAGAVNGRALTEGDVKSALLSLKGAGNVTVMPIVYTSNAKIKRGIEDENEMGHGYLDLMADPDIAGTAGDLASVDRVNAKNMSFETMLKGLGQAANTSLGTMAHFPCNNAAHHPLSVNPTKVLVTVVDKKGNTVANFTSGCTATEDCKGFTGFATFNVDSNGKDVGGIINVPADKLEAALKQANYAGGTVNIEYETRSDVDAKTGEPKTSHVLFRPKKKKTATAQN